MPWIECDENWVSLKRYMRAWAASNTSEEESVLWHWAGQAFATGLLDSGPLPKFFLLDKAGGRVLSPKGPHVFQSLRPLQDAIFISVEGGRDIARLSKLSPPPGCSDVTKGATQPRRPPTQLPPAPVAMILDELRSEYNRAEAAAEKPPNVKEVSRPVQLKLLQKGYWASRRQIEKLAEAEEFKALRWPPGKRR
jgi:hypothetical protein